jgi:hypothetical protein
MITLVLNILILNIYVYILFAIKTIKLVELKNF